MNTTRPPATAELSAARAAGARAERARWVKYLEEAAARATSPAAAEALRAAAAVLRECPG